MHWVNLTPFNSGLTTSLPVYQKEEVREHGSQGSKFLSSLYPKASSWAFSFGHDEHLTQSNCFLRSSTSMLSLFTVSINTIMEEKANITLQKLLLFFTCRWFHWFSPLLLQARLQPLLPNASHQFMDTGNSKTTCTRIKNAKFLTSHHRTKLSCLSKYTSCPQAPLISYMPTATQLPEVLCWAALCRP